MHTSHCHLAILPALAIALACSTSCGGLADTNSGDAGRGATEPRAPDGHSPRDSGPHDATPDGTTPADVPSSASPACHAGVVTLASGLKAPLDIAVDGTSVYWIDAKSVQKVPLCGGAPTVLGGKIMKLSPK